MKLLSKEEEDAHYSSVLKGGTLGTLAGLAAGVGGVMFAQKRYATIRHLTLPMKSFLVTSSGTFVGIISADNASRSFEASRNAERQWYENREQRLRDEGLQGMSFMDRAFAFARREKYKIVSATWVASMIGSWVFVGRNPFLSGQQKIVQARVYAQGLTLAVLVASAAFEISDQKKGRGMLKQGQKADMNAAAKEKAAEEQQGNLWKDMVAAEEERLKQKHQSLYEKPHAHAEELADQGEKGKN
ncbi:HIG1 domain-containing protein [Aspergillus ruber CBS 135680]|uniref:HIG1 domain-containing protein n=1 Tax=Aspergillus ruber (strain CBS 135680) TaxID=1388766 RepID=A0A017S8D4_ASPRC|nr:uncharacterized protein EURHEDRAFT_195961 [Aspergillus ruber CBS 135680]EYE92445.1 hypothetical protein EURHEDRAFT_195961 [Aspergillus ruber CBS 135680]